MQACPFCHAFKVMIWKFSGPSSSSDGTPDICLPKLNGKLSVHLLVDGFSSIRYAGNSYGVFPDFHVFAHHLGTPEFLRCAIVIDVHSFFQPNIRNSGRTLELRNSGKKKKSDKKGPKTGFQSFGSSL